MYSGPWSLHWAKLAAASFDAESPILSLAVASSYALAVNSKSLIFAWGSPAGSRAGDKESPSYTIKKLPETAGRIKSIASGSSHSLALDYSGNLFAWGSNRSGQLGNL